MSLPKTLPLGLVLFLAACAEGPPPPRWQRLEPVEIKWTAVAAWNEVEGVRRSGDGEGLWIDYPVADGSWKPTEASDVWTALRPHGVAFQKVSAEELTLFTEDLRFRKNPSVVRGSHLDKLGTGEFAVLGDRIYCGSEENPGAATFGMFRARRMQVSTQRPVVGTLAGDGIALWPGEECRFDVELEGPSILRFYAAAEALGLEAQENPVASFVVRQAGREILRTELPALDPVDGRWLEVDLADVDGPLTVAVEGDLAVTGIFDPVVAPKERGAPGERPWADPRPNLVLFVADTFRADNLEAYGGDPAVAPLLNELAAESLVFERTWSTAAWTLPAHGSMFTGLYPEQHGASDEHLALSTQLQTLAELLQEHGYRTGAVTDSGFVSRNFGFDQGFAWFLELKKWDLRETLRHARDFVRADDGRPFFLFVQTYRTHAPYRVGPDEDSGPLKELTREAVQKSAEFGGSGEWDRRETGRRFLKLYNQGVSATDAQVGRWVDELEGMAAFDPGYFVFTSDHGEAFYEHTEMGHGGVLWEEKIRIPLFLRGPGIDPGTSSVTASLVDLYPTLTTLGRIPPAPFGEGRDLLADPAEVPAYSFARLGDRSMFAVIDGTRKLYGHARPDLLAQGECKGATDLALDPLEEHDMRAEATWPADLARQHAGPLERLMESLVPAVEIELSPEERNFLDDIGYGD